ncbi:hypothetical protein BN2497_5531 [Janthinobacterium sp. CG23_2]|nr:hypothetical protein BN2497_5531 [Janthinobacterium sp. CG23_2]CUU29163.1 hypothetical protein BN3177_5531 [Janthinobacterium sp. CG23_2]
MMPESGSPAKHDCGCPCAAGDVSQFYFFYIKQPLFGAASVTFHVPPMRASRSGQT